MAIIVQGMGYHYNPNTTQNFEKTKSETNIVAAENSNTLNTAQQSANLELPKKSVNQMQSTNSDNTFSQKQQLSATEEVIKKINNHFKNSNQLSFSVDKTTKQIIVKIIDTENNEIIKQIPSEQALALSQAIAENINKKGILLDQKV